MLEPNKKLSIIDTTKKTGKEVILGGWVFRKRDHGKVSFIDLRDATGNIQLVITDNTKVEAKNDNWGMESVILVKGLVKKRPPKLVNKDSETGHLEIEVKELNVISPTTEALPLDISKDIDKINLDTLLNYRSLTLRNPKIQSIFKLSEQIEDKYQEYLKKEGFTKIHTPKIIPQATEGGANVFQIDYFGKDVFLAQSPQFYKQKMVGVFEKVYEIGPVYRAEPHYTSRHLNEYTSLDAEMGFIKDENDVMDKLENCIKYIISKVDTKEQKQYFDFDVPQIPKKGIPRITLKEVKEIVNKKKKAKDDDLDLGSDDEKILGEYAKEKLKSDFVFVTEYPVSIRPFYQMPADNPNFTKSFDLIFKGLELTTGAQRIHDPKLLIENIKKHGMNPKDFKDYINVFKYGMPPHGGWGMGLERFTKQWLNLDNVRLSTLFPRDVKRLKP